MVSCWEQMVVTSTKWSALFSGLIRGYSESLLKCDRKGQSWLAFCHQWSFKGNKICFVSVLPVNFLIYLCHSLGAPQSQHTSFPVILLTSPRIALVSSCTMLFSPTCWSPLKAWFNASSLLFWSTEIQLEEGRHETRQEGGVHRRCE